MSGLTSILYPTDFKSMETESDSDSEGVCDVPLPFSNISDDRTLDQQGSDDTKNSLISDNDREDAHIHDGNIFSDAPLSIVSDLVNSINDSKDNIPVVTPKKSSGSSTLEPVTPTANLKMLMNVLSPMLRDRDKQRKFDNLIEAAEKSREEDGVPDSADPRGDEENEKNTGCTSRKSKSLGLLCQKFLSRYPDYPEDGQVLAIPLDIVSKDLNVERRRIYDIVNVLESVEMVSRKAKNKYVWHGKANLLSTLTRLQEIGEKENYGTRMAKLRKLQSETAFRIEFKFFGATKQKPLTDNLNIQNIQNHQDQKTENIQINQDQKATGVDEKTDSRKDKSLGVMSQKFIMLFLVSNDSRLISLDDAARILIGDENFQINESSKLKTKVRRLYDIANILTSLQLIKKVHVTESKGRKPAFKWIGPHPLNSEIDIKTVKTEKRPVTKHSLLCSAPSPDTSLKKKSWGRHSSFNVMSAEVAKDQKGYSSAPNTPVKQDKVLDKSFQADFAALKRKYPDQMSSLRKLCNQENIPNKTEEVAASRFSKNGKVPKVSGSTGSGPCRALFGDNANTLEVNGGCQDLNLMPNGISFQTMCKRPLLMPKTSDYQPVVKKSKCDINAIALLQQHGFSKEQLDSLIKEGTTLKVVKVYSGTDQPTSTFVAIKPDDAVLKTITSTASSDVDLLCQEKISPMPKKTIKEFVTNEGAGKKILPENTVNSPLQNGDSSEHVTNISSSNPDDTPVKPIGVDIAKFPTKKLYKSPKPVTSSPGSPSCSTEKSDDCFRMKMESRGKYLFQSSGGITRVSLKQKHASSAATNTPAVCNSFSLFPSSPSTTNMPVVGSPLLIPHEVHHNQFQNQSVGKSPIMSTRISPFPTRVSPIPISPMSMRVSPISSIGSYQCSYLVPPRLQFKNHDASSLLKGLTSLSPIQPSTNPNPYITPPSGSLMQNVVSGFTAFQNRMPGSISHSIQRQLTLKTPDSKK